MRQQAFRPHSNKKAFTIYELLFVVVIIGVLFATALPRFVAGDEQTALQTTSSNFASLSAYARQSAISASETVIMCIYPEDRVWYIDIPRPEDEKRDTERRREKDWDERKPRSDEEKTNELHRRLEFAEILINGEEVDEDKIVINFYPNGTVTAASIILRTKERKNSDKEQKQMTIDLEGATGQVAVYQGEPKNFADILEEAGLDVSQFEGATPSDKFSGNNDNRGNGFSLYAGSSEERSSYYSDAAARIMNKAARNYEREKEKEQLTGGAQDF